MPIEPSVDMSLASEQLKERTLVFAVTVLRLIDQLPRTPAADVVGRQLARSATSIAANYRAACTARSRREFIAKLCIVVEEADESVYWLELMIRAKLLVSDSSTHAEACELRAIFAKSLGTARTNLKLTKSMTR